MTGRGFPFARLQYAVLALLAAAATAALSSTHPSFFTPYLGDLDPVLAVVLSAAFGAGALSILRRLRWFEIFDWPATVRGLALSGAVAPLFAAVAILVDLTLGFRRDINVPAPWSLPFYPAIAFVAEVWFHAVPLALVAVGAKFAWRAPSDRLVAICAIAVALIEPAFQVRSGLARLELTWLETFVGFHVFVINLFQLYLFRRHGFVAMYGFRFIYYAWWHVAWGSLRLQLIF